MKTLKTVLKEIEAYEVVYIGTIRGSGWLVIDTAQNVLNQLEEINEDMKREARRMIDQSQDRLNDLPTSIVAVQNEIKNCNDEDELKKLKSRLLGFERTYASSYNSRMLYEKSLRSWKPIAKRGVHDMYEHKSEPGTCIILTGFESGKYWLKCEYESRTR